MVVRGEGDVGFGLGVVGRDVPDVADGLESLLLAALFRVARLRAALREVPRAGATLRDFVGARELPAEQSLHHRAVANDADLVFDANGLDVEPSS